MRKNNLIWQFVLLVLFATACDKYDDGEIWDRVNSLDNRVTLIENQLKLMNSNINSISGLVDALQNRLYITNVATSKDGYTLTFSDGSHITITDGKDGRDGVDGVDGKDAPVINIRYYDGHYYWVQTIDGETTWLTDSDGNKIPASGLDGVTPIMKVNADGYWIISYDNGNSYTLLRDEYGNAIKASGEDGNSFFESIEVTEDELRIILKDGTEIVLPLGDVPPLKAIDLGLSVKWASFNMGATTATESGGLYHWGDATNSGGFPYYNAPDVDNICGTEYDIARVNWGSTWRMPSQEEQEELIFHCTWNRTVVNGVKGMRITGYNGNSIFLPPTGFAVANSERSEEHNGYYWVGESYKGDNGDFAYTFYFNEQSYYYNGGYSKNYAKLAIRAVKE